MKGNPDDGRFGASCLFYPLGLSPFVPVTFAAALPSHRTQGLLLTLVLEVAPSSPVPPACFTLTQRLPNSENVLSPKSPALDATVSLTFS